MSAGRIGFTRIFFLTSIAIILAILIDVSINYGLTNPLLTKYRVVRTVSVVVSGLTIGFSAVYLQGCLRNPLVDHYIVGVGSGALLATYVALLTLPTHVVLVRFNAVIGGLLALLTTIAIAEYIGGGDYAYILAGIGVNAFLTGASLLLSHFVIKKNPWVNPINMLTGSFINSSSSNVPYLIAALSIVAVAYAILAKPLNTMLLGDDYSKQIGFNPRVYRLIAVASAGAASSIVVSIHGIIGFIGLISPHLTRLVLKTADHRFVTVGSALISSTLLLTTDISSRFVFTRFMGEVPAGAIVSCFGAPIFVALLIARFRGRSF